MVDSTENREHRRTALVFISYVMLLLPILTIGLVGAWRGFEKISRFDLGRKASLTDAVLMVAAIGIISAVLIYVTNICWLVLARCIFSRREAARLVFWGPTSRFDRWLFKKAFPD